MEPYLRFAFACFAILLLACNNKTSITEQAPVPTNANPNASLKALIIDGENNHGVWPMTTAMMKDYLEQTDLFKVDVRRTAYTWQGPHFNKSIGLDDITDLIEMYPIEGLAKTESVEEPKPDPNFNIDFNAYDLIISNMGWKSSNWSESMKKALHDYISDGGGLVIVHAANNAWGDWPEYNKMIGLGGWGGRNTDSGPYVYYKDDGELVYDPSEGSCGSHGAEQEYLVTTRAASHPIMKGLPITWMHTKDELYDRLRGPAENLTVLATGYSDTEKNSPPWDKKVKGTGHHEPLLFTIDYDEGRIFHTVLGHMDYSMECVGFITTLQRGAEWAATGAVTQGVPKDFPTADKTMSRKWKYSKT